MLRSNPLCRGGGELDRDKLTWEFLAQPSPVGRRYDARIEYRQGRTPRVFVTSPDIVELADGRELPHVYSQVPPRLCLYLPGAFEWERRHRLDPYDRAVDGTVAFLL